MLPAVLVGDNSRLYYFKMIIVKTHLRTAFDTYVLQHDILMIQYQCNAL